MFFILVEENYFKWDAEANKAILSGEFAGKSKV